MNVRDKPMIILYVIVFLILIYILFTGTFIILRLLGPVL